METSLELDFVLLMPSFQCVAAGPKWPFLFPKDSSQTFPFSGGTHGSDANEKPQVYERDESVSSLTERYDFGPVWLTLAAEEVTSVWRALLVGAGSGQSEGGQNTGQGADAAGDWLASLPPHRIPKPVPVFSLPGLP